MQLNSSCVQQKQQQFLYFWGYLQKNPGTKEDESPNLVITLELLWFLEELSSNFGTAFLDIRN